MSLSQKLDQLFEKQSAPEWADLDVGIWFQLTNLCNPFEGKFGKCYIMTHRNVETDEVKKVFSIQRLPMEIVSSDIEKYSVFIKSNGLKDSQASGNSYFDF